MTIAIAIRAPLTEGRRLIESVVAQGISNRHYEEVALLTDSRFTTPGDPSFRNDRAAKIWHPQPGVACVFSGQANAAELSFSRARREFERRPVLEPEEARERLSECVRHTVRNVLRTPQERANPLFWSLVGVGFRGRNAEILKFDPIDDFEGRWLPQETEVDWVGHPEAGGQFVERFYAEIQRQPEAGQSRKIPIKGSEVGGLGVAILSFLIDEVQGTIGGPIQWAVVSDQGTQSFQAYRGNASVPEKLRFEEVTASWDEVGSADRSRDRLRKPQPDKLS